MFKYKTFFICCIICCLTLGIAGCETIVAEPGQVTTLSVRATNADESLDAETAAVDVDGTTYDLSLLTEIQQQLVSRIIDKLSTNLQRAPTEINLIYVEEVEWADASLGCPKPGEAYAQMITTGYRMELEVNGENHVYHTSNRPNSRLVESCEP